MKTKKVRAHTRYYLADKKQVPGVTTVLGLRDKPQLKFWANKLGLRGIDVTKYVDELADIGSLAHVIITDKLSGQETDYSDFTPNQLDMATNSVLSYLEWEKNHNIEEMYFCERPMVSETHRFGGTLDIYCKIDGYREIIDLKTGNGIYDSHKWQVATLKKLLEENGFPVDRCRVLNIPRSEDEGFAETILTPKEIEKGWHIFKGLLYVYYAERDIFPEEG